MILLLICRTDLEKAITSHGGPSVVAERLGWKLQAKPRKPRGYWDSLDNVKSEVDEFIQDNDLEPGKINKSLYFFFLTQVLLI